MLNVKFIKCLSHEQVMKNTLLWLKEKIDRLLFMVTLISPIYLIFLERLIFGPTATQYFYIKNIKAR